MCVWWASVCMWACVGVCVLCERVGVCMWACVGDWGRLCVCMFM